MRVACIWLILVGLYAVIMSDRGYNSCQALFALSWPQPRRWHQHLFRFSFSFYLLYKVKVKTLRWFGHSKFQLHVMEYLKDNIKL